MTRFKKALDNGRRWLLFAPQRGKFWGHACVARMLAYDGVFRTPLEGAGRAREDIQVVALHSCQTLHQSVMELDCSSEQGILQLIPDFQLFKNVEDALLHNILDGLGLATAAQLPTSPSLWTAWLGSQLSGSTRRLQRAPVQESVVPVLADLLATMQPGQELEHLKFLLRWADHRGSDVRLLTNSVIHGSSQPAPYPAFAWDWESVQQYRGARASTSTCWSSLRCSIFSICGQQLVKSPGNGFSHFRQPRGCLGGRQGQVICTHSQPHLSSYLRCLSVFQLLGGVALDGVGLATQRLCQQGRGAAGDG